MIFVHLFYFLLDFVKFMQYCLSELEVNNIAIKLAQINFDKDTKDELNKFAKTYRMGIKYYYGYISKFDKINVHTISTMD